MSVSIPRCKADVLRDYHSREGRELPALNVKSYDRPEYTAERIMREFGCTEAAAERAAENVYESEREQFWEYDALELINHVMHGDDGSEFKPSGLKESPYKVYSEGRSGGWLIVHGLAPVSEWDGAMFQKWRKYARLIKETIAWKLTWEAARELIECNEWAPRADTAKAQRADMQRDSKASRRALEAFFSIHGELDGQTWDPGTLNRIAEHVRGAGLAVREPEVFRAQEGGE